jgi:hypothetical protein
MRFNFIIGRVTYGQAGITIETLRTPAEEARRAKARKGGDVYTNCSFERPFPIGIPTPAAPQIKGNDQEAIDRAHNLTGLDREIVERVWDEIKKYYQDKNQGGA